MAFIYVQKNKFEPFEVEYVAQNEEENKELIAKFSIKHIMDWPEKALDDFVRLENKWTRLDSLLKKNKKKIDVKQANEAVVVSRAMNNIIAENGIVEEDGRTVWQSLPIHAQIEITGAWFAWSKEASDEFMKENK
jgi:hypothetical protein